MLWKEIPEQKRNEMKFCVFFFLFSARQVKMPTVCHRVWWKRHRATNTNQTVCVYTYLHANKLNKDNQSSAVGCLFTSDGFFFLLLSFVFSSVFRLNGVWFFYYILWDVPPVRFFFSSIQLLFGSFLSHFSAAKLNRPFSKQETHATEEMMSIHNNGVRHNGKMNEKKKKITEIVT